MQWINVTYYGLMVELEQDLFKVSHPSIFPDVIISDNDYRTAIQNYQMIINRKLHQWLSDICFEITQQL